jgi:hypothetical protein
MNYLVNVKTMGEKPEQIPHFSDKVLKICLTMGNYAQLSKKQ